MDPPYLSDAFNEYVHCYRLHVSYNGPFDTVLLLVFDITPKVPSPECSMVAFSFSNTTVISS